MGWRRATSDIIEKCLETCAPCWTHRDSASAIGLIRWSLRVLAPGNEAVIRLILGGCAMSFPLRLAMFASCLRDLLPTETSARRGVSSAQSRTARNEGIAAIALTPPPRDLSVTAAAAALNDKQTAVASARHA